MVNTILIYAIARFVIDEAHCVSEMGHDYRYVSYTVSALLLTAFRPDYAKLGQLRRVFPEVPILALSATCPPKVLQNLSNTLGLQYPPKRGTGITKAHAGGLVSEPLSRGRPSRHGLFLRSIVQEEFALCGASQTQQFCRRDQSDQGVHS